MKSIKSSKPRRNKKYVYFFGKGKADGNADMKNLLGGKGANLAEMTNLGVTVPAGFTITTEVCTYYYQNKQTYPLEMDQADGSRSGQGRKYHGPKIRRPGGPSSFIRPLRSQKIHAGYDGNRFEYRADDQDHPRTD